MARASSPNCRSPSSASWCRLGKAAHRTSRARGGTILRWARTH